ncbi:MBL fold metallo-hydrolase [Brevibacillus humidisoli]|nr:MBL fold metallo-hydrolase [Brevibacillus humidisoli]UFJ43211.1 MBL fold metallo-hydrolase [Brevibacillus humidisoli]
MINERVGYFPGSVNIGFVETESGAVLIDSGLDSQTAKKVKKGLTERGQSLTAIVQTHAHADHYGGNAYLLGAYPEATVFAPPLEEAVMRYPLLEPIYLNMGASPPGELHNKFLLAAASRVDQVLPDDGVCTIAGVSFTILPLPGHSWQQIGLVVDDICFAADSYFGSDVLDKHKLPFLVDAYDTINSLRRLLETDFTGYLPGHGPYERRAHQTMQYNLDYHLRMYERLEELLAADGTTTEDLLTMLCERLKIDITSLSSYVLYRTALMGYLSGMLREERVTYQLSANRLLWQKSERS